MCPRKREAPTTKPAVLGMRDDSDSEKAILVEMFQLLEEYGPMWYTEELHDRVTHALIRLAGRRGFTLIAGRADQKWLH